MTYRRTALSLTFFIGAFFFPQGASAATLYIDPYSVDVFKGDSISVNVRIDTEENECINTVDAVISYSEGIEAVDVSRGKSILTLWVADPAINKEERKITFAGGIPNGYCGRIPGDPSLTNIVAQLVFRAPGFTVGRQEDVAKLISFESGTRVLLNDGEGTEASLKVVGGNINLLQEVGTSSVDTWRAAVGEDKVPPQVFSVELVQNDEVFGGNFYIVFNTTDKQSGIDRYEILEESRDDLYRFTWGRATTPWEEIKSPYVLKDQSLSSVIRVKAIDKAGNERMTVLIPDEAVRPVNILLMLGAAVLGLSALGVISMVVWWLLRRRAAKKIKNEEQHI